MMPLQNRLFGPQFSLLASATVVNERPPKSSGTGSREATPPTRGSASDNHRVGSPGNRLRDAHHGSSQPVPPERVALSHGHIQQRPGSQPASSTVYVEDIVHRELQSTLVDQHSQWTDAPSSSARSDGVLGQDGVVNGVASSSSRAKSGIPHTRSADSLRAAARSRAPSAQGLRSASYSHTQGLFAASHTAPYSPYAQSSAGLHSPKTTTTLKHAGYLPGDRVVFVENPTNPEAAPVVYRTPEERAANPDRLNLDRRGLHVCPVLEGEDQLRLLNYQHNSICRIQHLHNLRRLIFLDLYDNSIQEISGLNNLKSLRVLMLGKNRIKRIESLETLLKLDVLDLHGNQITKVENLGHLTELRVLNLAGNLISHVDSLADMDALTELNLRRNRIRAVEDVESLPSLQRLFLSYNEITCFEDVACLGESSSLSELSLDGNPFAQDGAYKQMILRNMATLKQLDMRKITDDERRISSVIARKEDEKRRENNKIQLMKEKRALAITTARRRWESVQREIKRQRAGHADVSVLDLFSEQSEEKRRLAISNARRQWEVMQGSIMGRTNRIARDDRDTMPALVANHVGSFPASPSPSGGGDSPGSQGTAEREDTASRLGRPASAKAPSWERDSADSSTNHRPSSTGSRSLASSSAEQGKISYSGTTLVNDVSTDYLAELDGATLSLYGQGALDALDRAWGMSAAGAVTAVHFSFIDFDEIAKHLGKIRARFPAVSTLVFDSTNVHSLHQLNALASLRRLDALTVHPDANPVTRFALWRSYALFRLAHFSLKKINDIDVGASDVVNAEKFFGPLAHITTSQLPQSRLASLLGENKRKQLQAATEDKPGKSGDSFATRTTVESVGRAGLVYTSTDAIKGKAKEQRSRREFVSSYVADLAREATLADQKRTALRAMWPELLREMVERAIMEMWDSNSYMKRCLEELERSTSS